MGNNPIANVDPNGGMNCGGPGQPPCELPAVDLGNVGGKGAFDYSGMPDFMRLDRDSWTSSTTLNLRLYNTLYGTDFGSQNPGSTFSQWQYRYFFKPQQDDLFNHIHEGRAVAAEYISYILPTPLIGINITANGIRAAKVIHETYRISRAFRIVNPGALQKTTFGFGDEIVVSTLESFRLKNGRFGRGWSTSKQYVGRGPSIDYLTKSPALSPLNITKYDRKTNMAIGIGLSGATLTYYTFKMF